MLPAQLYQNTRCVKSTEECILLQWVIQVSTLAVLYASISTLAMLH